MISGPPKGRALNYSGAQTYEATARSSWPDYRLHFPRPATHRLIRDPPIGTREPFVELRRNSSIVTGFLSPAGGWLGCMRLAEPHPHTAADPSIVLDDIRCYRLNSIPFGTREDIDITESARSPFLELDRPIHGSCLAVCDNMMNSHRLQQSRRSGDPGTRLPGENGE